MRLMTDGTLLVHEHGSAAQGIGQALYEESAYDATSGQLLAGTLLGYASPTAARVPVLVTALGSERRRRSRRDRSSASDHQRRTRCARAAGRHWAHGPRYAAHTTQRLVGHHHGDAGGDDGRLKRSVIRRPAQGVCGDFSYTL